MSNKNKNLNQEESKEEIINHLCFLIKEWIIFLRGLFCPLVIIPLLLTVLSLYFANKIGIDKNLSLLLQIIATISGGVAISFFYDVIRENFEHGLLVKKGLSAVRNLSLARLKTKNISDREKEKATSEETVNSLSMLEKDIVNAIQEWNDILPGVSKIEEAYKLLSEKEYELGLIKKQKDDLDRQLIGQKELSEKEKDGLKEKLAKKEGLISDLESQINKLRSKADYLPFSGAGLTLGSLFPATMRTCLNCGKPYDINPNSSCIDVGMCDKCFHSTR